MLMAQTPWTLSHHQSLSLSLLVSRLCSIRTELKYIFAGLPDTGVALCRSLKQDVVYDIGPASPAVSRMSSLSYLDVL